MGGWVPMPVFMVARLSQLKWILTTFQPNRPPLLGHKYGQAKKILRPFFISGWDCAIVHLTKRRKLQSQEVGDMHKSIPCLSYKLLLTSDIIDSVFDYNALLLVRGYFL
jgi:hypothetical protein